MVLAEQIATLASIATGRFVLQCGLGWSEAQSTGLGVPYKERGAMLEASLDVMRRLWSGESVSEDKFWFIDEAISRPTPPEPIGYGSVRRLNLLLREQLESLMVG